MARINADGSYGWTRIIGGSAPDYAYALSPTPSGSLFIAGYFESTSINFAADWGGTDEKTSAGERDAFITKIEQ